MRIHLALLSLAVSSVAGAQPARIDAIMKPWTGSATPGCAVAVIQKGKPTHAKGYGMADLERRVPITPATLFDIGSTSKQLTAATILLLAAEGKLKLDDDIRTHLPELPALAKRPVTIRHLLHHTGGLRDYEALLRIRGKRYADVTTSRETLEALARQRGVDFEPGTKFAYSNTGYFLLAQIAERAGKRSMRELVRERIYKPLGMTTSEVIDDHQRIIVGRAIGYAPTEGSTPGWRLETSQWEQTGDGSVVTSVLELAKWDANFYNPKVGGKPLLDAQLQRGKLADGTELDYAAGLFHGTYRGQPTVAHGGAWAGYRAELLRFPAQQTSVIVLCNAASANPGALAREIADVVLAKQLGPKAAEPAPAPAVTLAAGELDAWVGRYRDLATRAIVHVRREGNALVAEAGGVQPLVPTSKHQFRIGPSPFTLDFAGAAPKRTIVLRGPKREETLVEVPPYTAAPGEATALAGRYWSPELAVLWTIRIEHGAAVLDTVDETGVKLEIVSKDEVTNIASGIVLGLVRGPRGIRGLTGTLGDLRGIAFERL